MGAPDVHLLNYRIQGSIRACLDAWGLVHVVHSSGTHGGRTLCGEPFNWAAAADPLPSTGPSWAVHPINKAQAAVTCLRCVVAR